MGNLLETQWFSSWIRETWGSRILTVAEIASKLSVSQGTIYANITAGRLHARRAAENEPYTIRRSDLEAWLLACLSFRYTYEQ